MIIQNQLEINFLQRKRMVGYFVYLVKLTNISDTNILYDMRKMSSLNGTNVLQMANSFKIEGEEILTNGLLGYKEEKTGYVVFLKNDFVTNEPTFTYEGVETKVSREI